MTIPGGVNGYKLLNFASRVDDDTAEQAKRVASVPSVDPYVVLMPNARSGDGSPVGIVVRTSHTVIPATIGLDIGCGMIAVRTVYTAKSIAGLALSELREAIEHAIPLSAETDVSDVLDDRWAERTEARIEILHSLARPDDEGDWRTRRAVDLSHSPGWREQLGCLSGSDDFISLCLDEDDRIWLLLRGGSGGVGPKIARAHITAAEKYCAIWPVNIRNGNLPYLVQRSSAFIQCLRDVNWAQRFAYENRAEMMDRFLRVFAEWIGADFDTRQTECGIAVERIDCPHNDIVRERRGAFDFWVVRNGAIEAHTGRLGLITRFAGNGSVIVEGRGDTAALCSAPCDAGARMSHNHARRRYRAGELAAHMSSVEQRKTKQWVDEFLDVEDLVDIRHTLRHMLVVNKI